MKIAIASDWFVPRTGGLELQLFDLACELSKRGHQVEVITGTPGPAEMGAIKVHRIDLGPLLPRLFFRGQDLHTLEPISWRMLLDLRRRCDAWLVSPVRNLVKAGSFDIVHGHSAYSPVALTACRAAREAGIASVLSEHSVSEGFGGVLLRAADLVWHWSRWPDVVAGVSSYVASELSAVTRRKIEVLPDGINPGEWDTENKSQDDLVVSVMRLSRRKRGIDVVRSIRPVSRMLGHAPRFVLIGDGPERSRIQAEARRLGVADQLEMPGRLDRAAIREILARATVFVLPTRKEALSIAVLEGLSAGVPVVAMAHGGVRDIIQHGSEGFLASNHQEFCSYTAQLLQNPSLRARLAANTRRKADQFNWEHVIARHLQIYELARASHASALVHRAA